jgi:sugar lactone lactonase YvrE
MFPIADFRLHPDAVSFICNDLQRPESVLARPDGSLLVSDRRGSVTRIDPDGGQQLLGTAGGLPNGIAVDSAGRIVVANIGLGQVHRLDGAGQESILFDSFEGEPLGAANFVLADREDVLWITVSTRLSSPAQAIRERTADGRIFRARDGVLRLVADGLFFANEMRLDRPREWAYVAETTAGRISRAPLMPDGSLGQFRPFGPAPLFDGAYVDGIAFDAEGNLWITELSRNAILVLTPEQRLVTVFDDPAGAVILKPTSLAFSGPDLRTVVVGSLKMQRLARFVSPIAGEPMQHWR